ncbi:hypothetical protein [Bradyrhizobium valentinum]|uniref:hypothetical protein n=1 Tax=Bradyrhizobium valentinum TaxID=1518501 RepID=UPI000AC48D72|nr:hypothetical protein [Bradyrhizobium valentinum]
MGRNRGGDGNALLAASGYSFHRLIRGLTLLLRQILIGLTAALHPVPDLKQLSYA